MNYELGLKERSDNLQDIYKYFGKIGEINEKLLSVNSWLDEFVSNYKFTQGAFLHLELEGRVLNSIILELNNYFNEEQERIYEKYVNIRYDILDSERYKIFEKFSNYKIIYEKFVDLCLDIRDYKKLLILNDITLSGFKAVEVLSSMSIDVGLLGSCKKYDNPNYKETKINLCLHRINYSNCILFSTNDMDLMSGIEFEHLCAMLLRNNGFTNVATTKTSGDYGGDITATKGQVKYVIQCKRYTSNIGVDAVQQVLGSKSIYNAHVGIVMTNRYFTPNAKKLAEANNIILWDRDVVLSMKR